MNAAIGWWHLVPWSAGEDVEGAWAKASRSRRTEEDCLRAELNREFYKIGIREAIALETEMYRPLQERRRVLELPSRKGLRLHTRYVLRIVCTKDIVSWTFPKRLARLARSRYISHARLEIGMSVFAQPCVVDQNQVTAKKKSGGR